MAVQAYRYPFVLVLALGMGLVSPSQNVGGAESGFAIPETVAPQAADPGAFRELASIEFVGLQTFEAEQIANGLLKAPEVFAALHPSATEVVYRTHLRQAILRGFQSKGFFEASVQVSSVDQPLAVTVSEGPRYEWGELNVRGVALSQAKSIHERLLKIDLREPDDDDEKLVWKNRRHPSCLSFDILTLRSNLKEGLSRIGLAAEGCEVTIEVDEVAKQLVGDVQVPANLHWLPDAGVSAESPVSVTITDATDDLPYVGDNTPIANQLRQIYRKNFVSPFQGFRLVLDSATPNEPNVWPNVVEIADGYAFVDSVTQDRSAGLQLLVEGTRISFKVFPDQRTWPLYLPSGKITLTRSSATEGDEGKTWNLRGASSTEFEGQPRGEYSMTPAAFAEMLVPSKTVVRQVDGGKLFVSGESSITVNDEGFVTSLRTIGSKGLPEAWTSLTDKQVSDARAAFWKTAKVEQPIIGERLLDLVKKSEELSSKNDDQESGDNFFVPPLGDDQLLASIAIMVATELFDCDTDSTVGRLLGVYAAIQSQETTGIAERLEELEPEMRTNALIATASGYLAGLAGWEQRSKEYSQIAIDLLVESNGSLDREFDWLLGVIPISDELMAAVNMHSLARLASELATSTNAANQSMWEMLPVMFPRPADESQRVAQARQGLKIAWNKYAPALVARQAAMQVDAANKKRARIAKKEGKKAAAKKNSKEVPEDEVKFKSLGSQIR